MTYLENYISKDEAGRFIQEVNAASWRTDLKRRVQHYGYRYDYKSRQARRADYLGPLPELFQQLAERLTTEGHFQAVPDQVIVNEYGVGIKVATSTKTSPNFYPKGTQFPYFYRFLISEGCNPMKINTE